MDTTYPPRPGDVPPMSVRLPGVYFSPAGRALLVDNPTPAGFLARLVRGRLHDDALALIAHALPGRLLIWWGCLCTRGTVPIHLGPAGHANFELLVEWLRCPTADVVARMQKIAATGGERGRVGYGLREVQAAVRLPDDPARAVWLVLDGLARNLGRAGPNDRERLARQFIVFGIDVERGAVPVPTVPPGDRRG